MTTIDMEKTKNWHFPVLKRDWMYKKNGRWHVVPDELDTQVQISHDENKANPDFGSSLFIRRLVN